MVAECALFQQLKDILRDPGAVNFLHAGPQLVCQRSPHDPSNKVAAADPDITGEHKDRCQGQKQFSCHVSILISK